MHAIIITFDNNDPMVYGPYSTYTQAKEALPGIRKMYEDADLGEDDSITSVDVVLMQPPK